MDALEYRIQTALNSVIRETFPNHKIPFLYIEFMKKDSKTFHGDYCCKTKKARITNLSRPTINILITSLHEAAHHVEYYVTKQTGHKKSFYQFYNKLMITAIEMGMFTYEKARTVTNTTTIRQMERYCGPIIQEAIPEKKYKKDSCLIYVSNGYIWKRQLAERGYHYNSKAKSWEKEIMKIKKDDEIDFLKSLDDDINITVTEDMLELKIFAYIIITGNTYPCRKMLTDLGYRYQKFIPELKKNGWCKKVDSGQLTDEKMNIKSLENNPEIQINIRY